MSSIQKEIDHALKLKDDDIYELLGLAVQGTETVIEAKVSRLSLMKVGKSTTAPKIAKRLSSSWKERGERAFKKYRKNLKKIICAADGPYGDFKKGKFRDDKTLIGSVAIAILSGASIGTMIAVYIAILLVRAGLKTYCEKN